MQANLSNLPATSPVRSLTALARQIALPHEHTPQRFPSFPALERTALMGFSAPVQWDLGPGASGVTADENRALLTRQAGLPLWLSKPCSAMIAGFSHYFDIEPPGYTVTDNAFYNPSFGLPYARVAGNSVVNDYCPTISGFFSSDKMATLPIVGLDTRISHVPYLYVPAMGTLVLTFGSPNAAFGQNGQAMIKCGLWTPGGSEVIFEMIVPWTSTFRSGISTQQFLTNTWVRPISLTTTSPAAIDMPNRLTVNVLSTPVQPTNLVFTPSTSNLGTIAFSGPVPATRHLLPYGPPSELLNSRLPWEATRTTAAAALFTNVSQALNKNGTVLAGRVNPNVYNVFNATSGVLSGLHPAEKSYLGLETGLYTYCPPSTDMATFWDYTLSQDITQLSGDSIVPQYRLDNDSLVNVACFDFATGTTPSLAINLDWHVEFRTTSALFQIGISTMTLESLHLAQLSLHEAGFFFENPEHKGVLQKVLRSVGKYSAIAAPVVSAVHPSAGKVLTVARAGSRILAGSKATPKSTSLKAAMPGEQRKKTGKQTHQKGGKKR